MCLDGGVPRQDRSGQSPSRQRALSFDWTSSIGWQGKRELESLASMFMGIGNENVSGRAVVVGHVGTGKTVLTSEIWGRCSKGNGWHQKDRSFARKSCRNSPSTSQVLQQIALSLDSRHPERGFSSGEIIQSIRRNIRSRGLHMILVLDEVDVLVQRDSSDLIYKLSNRRGAG